MIKTVTSTTLFQDAVGLRMSITYSEIDENTGQVISDNKRIDRVITNTTVKSKANAIIEHAQDFVDALEVQSCLIK